MDVNLIVICGFTFVIHLIGTLAYASRITGIRTRQIATTASIFNIVMLISRTSNGFQAPFLAKRIENSLSLHQQQAILHDFYWIFGSAAVATLLGACLMPTVQRLLTKAVELFQKDRSLLRVLVRIINPYRMVQIPQYFAIPQKPGIRTTQRQSGLSWSYLALNTGATGLWTIGAFAALYAGVLVPEYRVTCSNLSSIVNGCATIAMCLILDPKISLMSDDVLGNRVTEGQFRAAIVSLVGTRFAGIFLSYLLFLPCAKAIAWVASWI